MHRKLVGNQIHNDGLDVQLLKTQNIAVKMFCFAKTMLS